MRFDILTLFPEMVGSVLGTSVIGRAAKAGIIDICARDIRDYTDDPHRRVDDTPYGGGSGMVMQAEPVFRAVSSVERKGKSRVIYMSPKGEVLTQAKARELSSLDQLIILCGHYEGVDQRVIDEVVDEEISIGDYVLTGGEMPACVLVDCVARMIDGVLAEEASYTDESCYNGLLEYPHYTRPPVWHEREVPAVLKSGDHAAIDDWRYRAAREITKKKRPDLF